jgi:hypothetical protein
VLLRRFPPFDSHRLKVPFQKQKWIHLLNT